MKLLKTFATGAAVLSAVAAANADTTFHITGSTAFRAATITAIEQAITGFANDTSTAKDNATLTSANNVMWTGSNGTLGNFIIKTSFNGSGAGVQLVSGTLPTPFLASTSSGVVASPTTGNSDDITVPDVAMSDAFQGATGFQGTVKTILSGSSQNHTYQTLTDNQVAIVTFKPMASLTFPQGTGTTLVDTTGTFNVSSYSMTRQNFSAVWNFGNASLALFTGNFADEQSTVYAAGRNPDSGTRITYLAESGYGVNNLIVQQFPSTWVSGTTTSSSAIVGGTISALTEYPIQTVNGISTKKLGNSGESSGSAVRAFLTYPVASSLSESGANSAYIATVLGTADSSSVAASSVELPWNGIYFSENNVIEGTYTLWGYEHMYYANGLSASNPNGKTFADSVQTIFKNNTTESQLSNAGIGTSVMHVLRAVDGGAISQKY